MYKKVETNVPCKFCTFVKLVLELCVLDGDGETSKIYDLNRSRAWCPKCGVAYDAEWARDEDLKLSEKVSE